MNRGGLGARSLNIDLQQALTPPGEPRVERFCSRYVIGDNMMQVENDYDREVYNGDLRSIDPEVSEMVIEFDGRPVTYDFGELDEVVLAYATTIPQVARFGVSGRGHPADHQHYPMLQRNLLYTAVTRGKRLVVIVGQKKAMAIAVKGKRTRRRWSKLRDLPIDFL
jgi:exodeoxyribonuclease V alpha subunit